MYKNSEKNFAAFLIFKVGNDMFASNADQVRNILDAKQILKQKHEQNIKLYGKLIPYYDTAEKIGLSKTKFENDTCVVVADVNGMEHRIGFIVSEVKSLADVEYSEIKKLPELGRKYNAKCIEKYFVENGKIIRIINLSKLVGDSSKIITRKYSEISQVHLIS